jgi:hypothetical protein
MDFSPTAWKADFAGEHRQFDLTIGGCGTLERVTGTYIGELLLRLAAGTWSYAMVRETVRQGLLGGGAGDAETADLVARFVEGRPIGESVQLAADILSAFVNGREAVAAAKKAQAVEQELVAALAAGIDSQPAPEISPISTSSAAPSS